ncbi:hypothetical protein ACM614_07360 [Streptomyces sp. 12297]
MYNTFFAPKGPPKYVGDLAIISDNQRFQKMLHQQDGHVIHVNTLCRQFEATRTACGDLWRTARLEESREQPGTRLGLLEITTDPTCDVWDEGSLGLTKSPCPDAYWIWIHLDPETGAQMDNGKYGAGSTVIKGYFTVSVAGQLGSTPPGVTNVHLRSVNAADVD